MFQKIILPLSFFIFSIENASEFPIEDLNRDKNKQQMWAVLPYLFRSNSMAFTVGAVGIFAGYVQPQMSFIVTTFIGGELEVQHNDLRAPKKERTTGAMMTVNSYRPVFPSIYFLVREALLVITLINASILMVEIILKKI